MSDKLQTLLKFRFYVLAASLTLVFVGSGSLFLVSVALKALTVEFDWPRGVPALAFGMQFLGGGLGGLLMGYLLDRVGAVVLPIISACAIATGSMLTVWVDSQYQFYAIYFVLFGFLGQGSLYAPLLANISKWYERRRGMMIGIVSSGQSLSGIVWPPVFGFAITDVGWRNGFIGYGIFAAIVMLPLCLILARKPPSATDVARAEALDDKDNDGKRRHARSSESRLTYLQFQMVLCAAIVGCCISMSLPLAHLVAHATDQGLPLTSAAGVLSATLFASFVTRVLIVGLLADRIGGLWALLCFSGLQTIMVGLLTTADSVALLYLIGIGFGLGYGGIFPVYAVIVREYMPPHEAGRRTGVVFLFGAAAMGLGSWMGGALFDATGSYTVPFLIGVTTNAINLIIIGALITRNKPRDDGEGEAVPAAA